MASFSVDVSDIVFAGGRTGSKVVTISNAPADGIGISNTGYGTHFRVVIQEQNVSYQIKTKATNTSGDSYSSRIRFYNNGDSTDYVDIPIVQYSVSEMVLYADNLTYTGTSGVYSLDIDYQSGSTDLYIDTEGGYNGSAQVTIGGEWLSIVQASTAVTDTGFVHYIISYTDNNVTSVRTGGIVCSASNWTRSITVTQEGGGLPALTVSPSSETVSSVAGTVVITVTGASTSDISYSIPSTSSWITFDHISGNDYYFNYTANPVNTYTRSGAITFSATGYLSVVFVLKQNRPMVFLPTSKSVGSSSGSVGIQFYSPDPPSSYNISYDISDSWITFDRISGSMIYFNYTANSGSSSRTGSVTFLVDNFDTKSFTLTQAGGAPSSVSVTPSSLSFGPDASYADISLSYGGDYYNVDATEVYTWTTVSLSDVSTGSATGTVSVASNVSTSSRSGNVYFSDELGASIALPIEQAGISYALSAVPSSLSFPASGGSSTTAVTYEGTLSAASFPSWLSQSYVDVDANHRTYTVTAASNGPTSSRTFNWRLDDSYNHCWVLISQEAREDVSLVISPSSESVDSSEGTVEITVRSTGISEVSYTINAGWIEYLSKSGSVYTFGYAENGTTDARQGTITFSGGGLSRTFTLSQAAGSAGSLSVSPSELNFSASGGTSSVTVSGGTGTIAVNTGSFPSWLSITSVGGGVYNITAAENSGSLRSFGVWFTDEASNTVIVDVYQQASSVVLSVSPSSKSFGSAGGSQVFRVTYNTRINYNTLPSWLSIVSSTSTGSSIEYTMTAAENTGASRSFNWVLSDAVNSVTVRILQSGTGPGPGGDVVVSPDSLVFGPDGGSSSVTVTYTGSLSINTDMFPGWLSMVSSGDTYTFSVAENIGTESRSFGVIFRSGGDTAVLNILQGGRYASFSVTPEKIEFGADASSKTVYFGFVPSAGLGYQVKSGTGGWLSVSMNTPVATVSVTNNYGTSGSHPRRSSSIKFYNLNDPDDYVVVLVEQEGANAVYSMWNDYFFTPDDVTEGDDFHFLISISGGNLNDDFYGLSPYIERVGRGMSSAGIVPLNISRYLNKCIEGNRYILFDDSYYTPYVWNQLWGEVYVDIKHLDENGDIVNIYPHIWFWNDWSYKVKCYDYNRTLNDPINNKGCSGMYVPFCVYTDILDTSTSYSVTKTDEIGEQVTNVLGNPHPFAGVDFAINCDRYYNAQRVDFKRGSETVLSYDMTHCGDGYLLYRNRFGGWDSFLIEGNIKKKDSFTRSYMSRNGSYDACLYDVETVDTNIKTSYELSTGWLSDDESERLVYHLLSSPTIYFHSFKDDSTIKVNIVDSSSEYKKFKNGRNLVSYVITVEDTLTRQVNR